MVVGCSCNKMVVLREMLKSDEPIKHFPEGWVSRALPPVPCSRPGLASGWNVVFQSCCDFSETMCFTPTPDILLVKKFRLKEQKGLVQGHTGSK